MRHFGMSGMAGLNWYRKLQPQKSIEDILNLFPEVSLQGCLPGGGSGLGLQRFF